MPHMCQFHREGQIGANVLVLSLSTGKTFSACHGDEHLMYLTLLAQSLGVPAEGLAKTVTRYANKVGKEAQAAQAASSAELPLRPAGDSDDGTKTSEAAETQAPPDDDIPPFIECPGCHGKLSHTPEAMEAHERSCEPLQRQLAELEAAE